LISFPNPGYTKVARVFFVVFSNCFLGDEQLNDCEHENNYRRILILFGMIFLIFSGFLVRLLMIQLIDYPRYSQLAATQRQGLLLKNILRGDFLDRHGKIIRGKAKAWYLLIKKANPARAEKISHELEPILGSPFITAFSQNKEPRSFWIYPKPLNGLQIKQILTLHQPECKILANSLRRDQDQEIAQHLLGFADQDRGLSGLEYFFQPRLRSRDNTGLVFTLNDGKEHFFPGLGIRAENTPNSGGVILTIDRRVQRIVEQVMDTHQIPGAIVILDAQNGQILAMASRPTVDISKTETASAKSHPFVNRAISAYHPGSIFKLVVLSAGLDSGILNPEEYFYDPGSYRIGSKQWLCTTSSRDGHGFISLTDALAYSCNPVFIQIAMRLQPKLILEYADRFGLGQLCNIGLPNESWGNLPSGIGLSEGEMANLALGQQDVYTTPLQIASMIQTIANDGIRCIPRLVLGTSDSKGAVINQITAVPSVRVIKEATAHAIKDMMTAVVAYGTGMAAGLQVGVAGKTGTAQVDDDPRTPPHAWFAGFTPLKVPKFITVVFCEQGLSGAETAAPIFKELMEKVTKNGD
jgi:penicillin-binding protein 2